MFTHELLLGFEIVHGFGPSNTVSRNLCSNQTGVIRSTEANCLLSTSVCVFFLLTLFFDPEDGGEIFLLAVD
jgi:hypothetical protein